MKELKPSLLLAAAFGLTASIQAGAFYIDRFDDPSGGEYYGPYPGVIAVDFGGLPTSAIGGFRAAGFGFAPNTRTPYLTVNRNDDGKARFHSTGPSDNFYLQYTGESGFGYEGGALNRAVDGAKRFHLDYAVNQPTQLQISLGSGGREGSGPMCLWQTVLQPGSGFIHSPPLQDWWNHIDPLDVDWIKLSLNIDGAQPGQEIKVTLDDFMFGHPDTYAGDVPEPASTALAFALGLAGLTAWRRCRA